MLYFFDLTSSNTSRTCPTRLFAVRSSLPTVTRTGSRWNEAASFRTESGHVALTKIYCERVDARTRTARFHAHIRVCRSAPWVVYPIIVRISFSKPLSNILSASSNTRYVTLQRTGWNNAREASQTGGLTHSNRGPYRSQDPLFVLAYQRRPWPPCS